VVLSDNFRRFYSVDLYFYLAAEEASG